MYYKKIFMVLIIVGVLPVIIGALSASFILLDLSLLNPICWNKVSRIASTVWLAFVSIIILIGVGNSYH